MKLEKFTIQSNISIRDAMSKMDKNGQGFLAVLNNDQTVGIVTDGDIRRAILGNVDLDKVIEAVMNKDFLSVSSSQNDTDIEYIFRNTRARHIPIIENGKFMDVIFEEEYFLNSQKVVPSRKTLDIPVVIMAGGKGVRLDPFTRILPKPLIPIGNKSMIEIIMDGVAAYGVKEFYISVNHKAKMVKAYFEEINVRHRVSYIEEDKPLGTVGALKFLENKIQSAFWVFNCDTIIEADFRKIYDFHLDGGNDLTLVGVEQRHIVPYGVCEVEDNGRLKHFKEKPSYEFVVNTGVYILQPDVLKFIPEGERFDLTELIESLLTRKRKVGVYTIPEDSWIDIGQWVGYKKAIEKLGFLND